MRTIPKNIKRNNFSTNNSGSMPSFTTIDMNGDSNLKNNFFTKDFRIMKNIQRTPKYIPPYISFSNESWKFNISKNRSKIKGNSKGRNNNNIFIINERQKSINDIKIKSKKNQKKIIFKFVFSLWVLFI